MTRTDARRDRLATAVLLGTAVLLWAAIAAADPDAGRAARRSALKAAAESAGAQHFRLLVIPVDFSDRRFAGPWSPGASDRLAALREFWHGASGGILRLETVLAPAVHLDGTRRDYSDLDLGGDLIRSRALATEALTATAAALPLALADGDGPDGVPGGADDDGEVDGVLILHAGRGLENDPESGLIQPLQSYLLEPVVSRGTVARRYAVAALESATGIWIHEVGHLLGLEDRYDLYLSGGQVDGETLATGGLGRYSVMASGWDQPIPLMHLDAYSRLQLGWATPQRPAGAAVTLGPDWARPVRLDLRNEGGPSSSYYLLETLRIPDPAGEAPTVEALIAYHVDEDVPEDGQSSSDPENRHIRVRLVGSGQDDVLLHPELWVPSPGPLPWSEPVPPYGGTAWFSLDDIRRDGDGGILVDYEPLPGYWSFGVEFIVDEGDTLLSVTVDPWGDVAPAEVTITVLDGDGRLEGAAATTAPLVPVGSEFVASGLAWTPAPGLTDGEVTHLRLTVDPGAYWSDAVWAWGSLAPALAGWPAGWSLSEAGWRRADAAGIAPAGWTVAAALGATADPAAWPDLRTANDLRAEMISPPLPPGTDVLLTHWYDLGPGPDGFHGDGAVIEYVLDDGRRVRATPLGGYPDAVDPAATTSLAGQAAFAAAGDVDDLGAPLWRRDVIPAPPGGRPFRLAFRQETDPLWSGRGWWLGGLEAAGAADAQGIAPILTEGVWSWNGPPGAEVQLSDDGITWITVASPAASTLAAVEVTRVLRELGWSRARLRVVIPEEGWLRVTREADALGSRAADPLRALAVWPNPFRDGCRIHLPEASAETVLDLYDLRGRRLRRWHPGPGSHVVAWDGRAGDGRRLPAGRYLLRASLDGATLRRSVTLLP